MVTTGALGLLLVFVFEPMAWIIEYRHTVSQIRTVLILMMKMKMMMFVFCFFHKQLFLFVFEKKKLFKKDSIRQARLTDSTKQSEKKIWRDLLDSQNNLRLLKFEI